MNTNMNFNINNINHNHHQAIQLAWRTSVVDGAYICDAVRVVVTTLSRWKCAVVTAVI